MAKKTHYSHRQKEYLRLIMVLLVFFVIVGALIFFHSYPLSVYIDGTVAAAGSY